MSLRIASTSPARSRTEADARFFTDTFRRDRLQPPVREGEGLCGILSQQRAPVAPAGVAAVYETFFMKSTRTIYARACSLHPNALALRVSKRVRPFAEDENRKWHHQFPR
ncbi:hypothetical protein GPU89_35045 [Burkholderia cepacia]|nr:hypothetical protein [Burkholderia cepacia]